MKRGGNFLFILFIIIFIVALVSIGFFSYKAVTSDDEGKIDTDCVDEKGNFIPCGGDQGDEGEENNNRRVSLDDIIPDINYSELEPFTCNETQVSEEGFINLVIISNKYENQSEFDLDVLQHLITGDEENYGLLSTEPFKTYRSVFNVYSIFSKNNLRCWKERERGDISKQLCIKNSLKKISEDFCEISRIDKIIVITYGKTETLRAYLGSCMAFSGNAYSISVTTHEFAHSFAELQDEYIAYWKTSDDGTIFTPNRYNKREEGFTGVNVDIAGCPKWCSGNINTDAECYPYYEGFMECLEEGFNLGHDPGIDSSYFDSCAEDFNNQIQQDLGYALQECELGVDCIEETGCYVGANSWYEARPYVCTIMGGYGGSSNCQDSFGKISEDYIISVIEGYERGEGKSC